MNSRMMMFSVLIMVALSVCAKKVKLTIDGTTSRSQTTLYLIVNKDTANAQCVPVNDGKFSIAVEVDKNDFIRLQDDKGRPDRGDFVLIPDSHHITVDMRNGKVEDSPMSQYLQTTVKGIQSAGPGTFHIDVFSEDPKAWEEARAQESAIRAKMEEQQRELVRKVMLENKDNNIPAWILYCFPELAYKYLDEVTKDSPKWMRHPLLIMKQ
ncbi:MAG: hypothetical protein IJ069_03800 [Prevotella sp.]|nr:hypothetical protein [Prevotella sp.]